jgi:uncharacterized membrane protein
MIDPIYYEWGGLLLRWLHVITAIAWIGSSFYFMHLDASIRAIPEIPADKGGAAWEAHGGGFYEVKKYLVAPPKIPEHMMWHKWESYSTWISGFFLLVWLYYASADLYLIDPAVANLTQLQAFGIGFGALVLGWIVYDQLCRSPLGHNDVALAAVVFAYVILMAYLFQHVFSGRGALLHTGALMATMMTGNVFFIIIPNQKKSIAALKAGQDPDPKWGKQGKTRSAHNNYLTLPVLFLMLSNHYPLTYATPYAFVIVALVLVAGSVIRHFYNTRHAGHGDPWWAWAVAAICIWLAVWISMSSSPGAREKLGLAPLPPEKVLASAAVAPKPVVDIVSTRCSMCHAREPAFQGLGMPPKNVVLDTPQAIAREKQAIYLQAVLTHTMPPNNLTEMTLDERRVLAQWSR